MVIGGMQLLRSCLVGAGLRRVWPDEDIRVE